LGSDAVVKCKTIFMGYKENESWSYDMNLIFSVGVM
jgi:hypothetical protein